MKRALLLSISTLVLSSSPAFAVDLSEKKGEELKNILNVMMQQYGMAAGLDAGYQLEGDVTVTPKKKYFNATLPHMSFKNYNGGYLDIGKIAVNAIPLKDENKWKMSFSLPSTMTAYDANKVPNTKITIGEQKVSLVYDKRYHIVPQLNATYDDIKIEGTAPDTKRVVHIPKTTLIHDWKESDERFYSGPSAYSFENLYVQEGKNKVFSAGKVSFTASMTNYDIHSKDRTGSMVQNLFGTPQAPEQSSAPNINSTALTDLLTEVYLNSSDALSFGVEIEDIAVMPTRIGQFNSVATYNIAKIFLGFGLSDLRKDSASIDLALGYKLDINTLKTPMVNIIPHNVDIALSGKGLPKSEIMSILKKPEDSKTETAENALNIRLQDRLLSTLVASSAELGINKFKIESNDYSIDMKGIVNTNDNARYKATGTLEATLTGLEKLNSSLGSSMAPTNPYAMQLRQVTAPLAMLTMIGKQQGDADIRTFDVELDAPGNIIVNGQNFTGVTSAGEGGYTPAPSTQKP